MEKSEFNSFDNHWSIKHNYIALETDNLRKSLSVCHRDNISFVNIRLSKYLYENHFIRFYD